MKKKWLFICLLLICSLALIATRLILNAKTDLPKLYFNGDISDMQQKSDIRNIEVSYIDSDYTFHGYATLKVQGTSSLAYKKKNYTINFYSDENHTNKLNVDFGWGSQNKYCLKANWIDKTHSRNIVTARLVSQIQQEYCLLTDAPCNGTIDGFPVEIYSNGTFLGLYTFNIPKDDWMFNMNRDNPNHIVICGENWEDPCLFKAAPNFENWSIEVGEESPETLEKMNRLFDFIMNSTDEEFEANFEQYLDLDATLNYYIMCEFALLKDNRGKNMLLATYDGLLWYPLLYDLDTSWGTSWNGKELWNYDVTDMHMERSYLFDRIEKVFSKELSDRYFELRESILTKDHVLNEFYNFQNGIPKLTFIKENIRWGLLNIPGYNISQIEEYLEITIDDWDHRYLALVENEQ